MVRISRFRNYIAIYFMRQNGLFSKRFHYLPAIFAQESLSGTTRLNTSLSDVESFASTQKYPSLSN